MSPGWRPTAAKDMLTSYTVIQHEPLERTVGMKSIVSNLVHGCVVLIHGTTAPSESDWSGYLDLVRSLDPPDLKVRVLVLSDGGAPTPSQRAQLAAAIKTREGQVEIRCAIITSSTFARGVMNAFRLIRPGYRAFNPSDLGQAFDYLQVSPVHAEAIKRRITTLVGAQNPLARAAPPRL